VQEDVVGCANLARAGAGVFEIYHFIARQAVESGELVEILQSASGRSRPFSILCPQNRHLSARVRAFVDFLIAALSEQ
jgi:DNA-binding transcriptional LysR family regulator